ncbi:hypothetical protein FHS19_001336 [Paenibacillus rhizosphaerae]|uniref:Uncharacterized protein n=1 Tax=Paenibacillus rhizosphaerae TaxID=297318 RepID=A0A839TJ66_9BACL|nr:hypothetical protein [Paenibacillus rhizosphaerae]MBB3126682.1 hypothetical protein [Paenibacillus rhizosphaerae]
MEEKQPNHLLNILLYVMLFVILISCFGRLIDHSIYFAENALSMLIRVIERILSF